METINVKVNGIDVQVNKGAKILDAAKKAGVNIPTLCAHSDIEPWAACGMCVVKVADARGVSPKLVRASNRSSRGTKLYNSRRRATVCTQDSPRDDLS